MSGLILPFAASAATITHDIDADFKNSSAGTNGGSIYLDSGTVNISGGNFTGNNALQGGAIYINRDANLNISSSNLSIANNQAPTAGAAIYNNHGKVTIHRNNDSEQVSSVTIANNRAGDGGAIYSDGGQLSIDGCQFNNNLANANGGAIVASDIKPPTPASITRSYFHDNSAGGEGASIYGTEGSTLNVSQDTFFRDKGGIYVDSLSNLNIINSTFVGDKAAPEGINVASGIGEATFSTIVSASLSGIASGFNLSNSILQADECNAGVVDDGGNLQFQNATSPNTISVGNRLLDPRGLEDNGGPTPTVALAAQSPAIDQILIGDCVDANNKPVTIDQRGLGRPFGPKCDIGAYEFQGVLRRPPGRRRGSFEAASVSRIPEVLARPPEAARAGA